jgi:hypothetical protein
MPLDQFIDLELGLIVLLLGDLLTQEQDEQLDAGLEDILPCPLILEFLIVLFSTTPYDLGYWHTVVFGELSHLLSLTLTGWTFRRGLVRLRLEVMTRHHSCKVVAEVLNFGHTDSRELVNQGLELTFDVVFA